MSEILKKLKNIKEEKKADLRLVDQNSPPEKRPPSKKRTIILFSIIVGVVTASTVIFFHLKSEREVALLTKVSEKSLTPTEINQELITFLRTKNSGAAIAFLSNQKTSLKDDLELVNNYGAILRLDKKPYEAIRILSDGIGKWPKSETLFNNRATAYLSIGDIKAAIGDLEHAILLNPTYSEALLNLGIAFEMKKSWENAYRYYSTYLTVTGVKGGTEEMLRKRMTKIIPMVHFERKKGIK